MQFLDWKKDKIFGLKLNFFPRFRSLCEAAISDTEAAVPSLGGAGEAEGVGGPGKLDIRSRINNLAFIFTLPHLVMISNLQKLIGIRTGKKPSIQPNEYMDTLLLNAKTTMKGKIIFF